MCAASESRAKARCASGCQGESTEAVCKGWGGVVRCGRGRAAALLRRQWRPWRVRVRGGDSVEDGTPGATRVVKKAEPEISAGGPARKARRRSRRDGCGRCAERRAREEGDSDLWASAGQRVTRATWAGGASVGRGGLRNGPALKRGWAGGKRESTQEKEKETGRARGAAWAAEGGERKRA